MMILYPGAHFENYTCGEKVVQRQMLDVTRSSQAVTVTTQID